MPASENLFTESSFSYLPRITVRSRIIYLSAILLFIISLVMLPLVKVDISTQSPGIIRSLAEKTEIRPLAAGTVIKSLIKENKNVQAGDTLLVLQANAMEAQLSLNAKQQIDKLNFIHDLNWLLHSKSIIKNKLKTQIYSQQAAQFYFQQQQIQNQIQKNSSELLITQRLYASKVIARMELEDKEFVHRKLLNELRVLIETQRSQWQTELITNNTAIAELREQQQRLRQERALYIITAPVTGSIQQLVGKYRGSYIQAGELLGTISPDGDLLAECYISPKDIGYIHNGTLVRFQIDAFNYNQWGLIDGKVVDISRDLTIIKDQQPVFKVRCNLNHNYLSLKNGYKGFIRKNLTVRARFMITRRSLWQLIFDKADNWMNPIQNNNINS